MNGARHPPSRDDASIDDYARRILVITAWMLVGFGLLIAAIYSVTGNADYLRVVANVVLVVVGATALYLQRIGRQRFGANLCIWVIWCMVTVLVAHSGGLNAPNLMSYPVLIVLAGWLLGPRPTLVLACLSAAVVTSFYLVADLLPSGGTPRNPHVQLVYVLLILALTAILTLLSRRSYLQQLDELERQAGVLAERDLELRKLSKVVEQTPEAVVITDPQGRIEYVNDAFVAHTGFSREEAIGQTPRILRSGKTPRATYETLQSAMAEGVAWRGEFVNRRKDGTEVVEAAIVAPIRQDDGEITHFVSIEQDLTILRQAESEIDRLANFDPLTGLPNRSLLTERLGQVLALRHDHLRAGALVVLDIDRFKHVNDGRGHAAGDTLLIAIARLLAGAVREGDTVARIGADEFALLLRETAHDSGLVEHPVMAAVARIGEVLRKPIGLHEGDEVVVRVSVGVTLFPEGESDSVNDVLRRADTALHRAKEAGGGRVEFHDQQMSSAAELRFRLERDLRRAIPAGELRLYLQPQVDANGRHMGAEVLVRWMHPEFGLVPPVMFIPVAEESDLIVEVDGWVLAEACRLIAREASHGEGLGLSVNVSPKNFLRAGFVEWLTGLLERTGVPHGMLTLEITESVALADLGEAVARMQVLAGHGVRFSIDDFGTGYSSLAYLKQLPIHELKIDRAFVRDAPHDAGSAALVETILAVARVMGLDVVAEGVETAEQAAFLNERGEVLHQGYLFGRPEEAATWIARWAADAPVERTQDESTRLSAGTPMR